jgi:hypothetical protein
LEGADVIVNWDGGPVFGKDALAKRVALHKLHGLNATQPASSKAKSADAAEGVNHAQHGFIFIGSRTTVGHDVKLGRIG